LLRFPVSRLYTKNVKRAPSIFFILHFPSGIY
jgi:hypothetical protein